MDNTIGGSMSEYLEQAKEAALMVDIPGLTLALDVLREYDEETAIYLLEELLGAVEEKFVHPPEQTIHHHEESGPTYACPYCHFGQVRRGHKFCPNCAAQLHWPKEG